MVCPSVAVEAENLDIITTGMETSCGEEMLF
jgi:hypothetical protein